MESGSRSLRKRSLATFGVTMATYGLRAAHREPLMIEIYRRVYLPWSKPCPEVNPTEFRLQTHSLHPALPTHTHLKQREKKANWKHIIHEKQQVRVKKGENILYNKTRRSSELIRPHLIWSFNWESNEQVKEWMNIWGKSDWNREEKLTNFGQSSVTLIITYIMWNTTFISLLLF